MRLALLLAILSVAAVEPQLPELPWDTEQLRLFDAVDLATDGHCLTEEPTGRSWVTGWRTWRKLFHLHERTAALHPQKDDPYRPLRQMMVSGWSHRQPPLSQGTAIGAIRLYEAPAREVWEVPLVLPSEGLPRQRHPARAPRALSRPSAGLAPGSLTRIPHEKSAAKPYCTAITALRSVAESSHRPTKAGQPATQWVDRTGLTRLSALASSPAHLPETLRLCPVFRLVPSAALT